MKRILIVDDEEKICSLLTELLQSQYAVTSTSDGDAALEKLESGHYDLMITDIVMPNKNGLEVIADVKNKYPELKIIAISGVVER